jgi:hypothetical protein
MNARPAGDRTVGVAVHEIAPLSTIMSPNAAATR